MALNKYNCGNLPEIYDTVVSTTSDDPLLVIGIKENIYKDVILTLRPINSKWDHYIYQNLAAIYNLVSRQT